MTARILAGTASWTDKPLIDSGRFYPREARSAEDRLRYYAAQFPLVEVDATYYGLPTIETAERWVERTPAGFTFDVKAYSLFTNHPTPVARLPKAIKEALPTALARARNLERDRTPPEIVDLCWSTYIDALAPLHGSGRLGVIVLQFPRWCVPGPLMHGYLEELRDRLGPYRGAVEFRNAAWLDPAHAEETLALLGDLGFTYVCVDEPQGFASSVPPLAAATARLGFVRFHGRNAAMWEARTETSSQRFDYEYADAELDEWVPKIAALAAETDELHLVMNTNNYDQGPANARRLLARLGAAGGAVLRSPGPPAEPGPTPAAAGAPGAAYPQGRLL
jgi:uncharacterized protein YecE (DUF72 family)